MCPMVLVPPRIIPFSFGESPIFAGEAAQVTCLVSAGDPPLDISWSFHSKAEMAQLGISTMKNGQKASMLLIESAGYQHRGVYTCTAKNPAGVTNFSTTLDIHGRNTPHMHALGSLPVFMYPASYIYTPSFIQKVLVFKVEHKLKSEFLIPS